MSERISARPGELGATLRLECPSEESFRETCLSANRPAVITGAMSDWKALERWTLSYFERSFGTTKVRVVEVPRGEENGFFQADERTGFRATEMTMQDYLGSLSSPGKPLYYLTSVNIKLQFPSLLGDIEALAYVPEEYRSSPRLWLGGGGSVSPLHYDASHKIHALVSGHKHFVLFDRNQFSFLYPNSFLSGAPNMSRVRFDHPDYRRFPRFRKARAQQAVLQGGDMLFLPAGWWHQVSSLETSAAVEFPWPGPKWGRPFLRLSAGRMHHRLRRRLGLP